MRRELMGRNLSIAFAVGEHVLLEAGILTLLGKHSLSPRNVLCRVEAIMSPNTVRLELPVELKTTHTVFNVQRLERYFGDSHFFARERAQRKPVVMLDSDGEELHVVDEIIERRLLRTPRERSGASAAPRYEYLVRWLDHGRGKDKWESDELAKDPLTAEMVRRFNVKQDAADAADGARAQRRRPADGTAGRDSPLVGAAPCAPPRRRKRYSPRPQKRGKRDWCFLLLRRAQSRCLQGVFVRYQYRQGDME